MESAVLKTISWADQFDYPLKAWEVHKWLLKRKANLLEVEKALSKLQKKKRIKEQDGYFFLSTRKGLLKKRAKREREHKASVGRIKLLSKLYKLNPKVKLTACYGELITPNCLVSDLERLIFKKSRENAIKVLQLQLLWERGKQYKKFLEENSWAFEYFPNFTVKKARSR